MGASKHPYGRFFWQRKGDKVGDKETLSFALVNSGWNQKTGDTETSVSKRQPYWRTWVYGQQCLILAISFHASSLQHELLASCRLNTLLLYLLCSFLTLCFLPCYNNAFPPYQPHHSPDSCTNTTFSLCLSYALLLLLTDDCTASWRRVCPLYCAKPFYVTRLPWPLKLTPSKENKMFHWQICLASVWFCILVGQVIWLIFSLSTYTMNHVFYCLMLYSVNCTQMVSVRPFWLNIWVFLPGELLCLSQIFCI